MNSLIATLLMLLEHAPAATPAAVKTASDIAHGEGGLPKVLKVVRDLGDTIEAAITGNPAPSSTAPTATTTGSSP